MSIVARRISSFGNDVRKFQMQTMNAKYTYPNVISALLSLFVTSFMAIYHGNLLPDPFQQRRGFSGFLLFMVCGTVWA